jgi:outer membrane protein
MVGLIVLGLSGGGAWAQATPPAGAAKGKEIHLAIVDLGLVLQNSAAGRSIREQVDRQGQAFQAELARRQAELQKQQSDLQAQQPTMSPDAFADKRRAFETDVSALQRQTDERKDQLQRATDDAMKVVQTNILQILTQEKAERGVDMIAHAGALAMADPGFDLTSEVLQRLDVKLPRVTVKLAAPVAGR